MSVSEQTLAVGLFQLAGMRLERVMMWMAVVGVVGFALTLVWMLSSR